jgi:NitT/TauT family transport system permease protein
VAWIPVAIALFGISEAATVSLIFLAATLPLTITVVNAARSVPEIDLRVGRNFGLSLPELLARVVLPAAMPEIVAGVRVALGVAWLVLVAAEMIAVDSGLGYLIIDARNAGKRYDLVVAAMFLIGLVGLALDLGVARLEKLDSVRWGLRAEGREGG